jgi:hypothetical protein
VVGSSVRGSWYGPGMGHRQRRTLNIAVHSRLGLGLVSAATCCPTSRACSKRLSTLAFVADAIGVEA